MKPKFESLLNEAKVGNTIGAIELLEIIQKEKNFKANWDGAWDLADRYSRARIVTINVGRGFEDAICISTGGGNMIYVGKLGNYVVDNYPTDTQRLLFYCDDAIFVKGI